MSTKGSGALDHSVPQWKRELILRRRAIGRALPAGSSSVQLTCPSVVVALRYPQCSVSSDCHVGTCASDREQLGNRRNMRLVEQVNSSSDFAESGLISDCKKSCGFGSSMGEERSWNKKKKGNAVRKRNALTSYDDDDDGDDGDALSDSSEELKYGPGIVSRLKSRYLSLTLRESQGRMRPALPYMRRATSLENILDGPQVDKRDNAKSKYVKNVHSLGGSASGRCGASIRDNKESMKRSGSVETLTRSYLYSRNCEMFSNVENDEGHHGAASASLESRELPPPDVVKHTLKIFENSTKNATCHRLASPKTDTACAKKPTVYLKLSLPGKVKSVCARLGNNSNGSGDAVNGNEDDGSDAIEKRRLSEEMEKPPPSTEDAADGEEVLPDGNRSTEPTDPVRSISPVLVRAPPRVLSAELAASHSFAQAKQLGVVRPMVSSKASPPPCQKCSVTNKARSGLTEREIEKNIINAAKSIEQPISKVIATSDDDSKPSKEGRKGLVWDSRKSNTMIFNFSNRKAVPDYIENDGLVLSKKDKPKRGESGIVFVGAAEDDPLDADSDDDARSNSPCDFVFVGDNILINGKSNIQAKPKSRKMKIQFNDEATTMFEYPSEASLLADQHEPSNSVDHSTATETSAAVNGSPAISNPFRCSGLASYTPSKVTLDADFELGVTKKATPPPASPAPTAADEEEEELEEYLRPADETRTVAWSSETAADLLF